MAYLLLFPHNIWHFLMSFCCAFLYQSINSDSIGTWAQCWRNSRWQGGTLDKLTTRMTPPQHTLHKNAEIADHYLPWNHLLPYRCGNHCSSCTLDQGLTTVWPFLGDHNGQSTILHHSPYPHDYQARSLGLKANHCQKAWLFMQAC